MMKWYLNSDRRGSRIISSILFCITTNSYNRLLQSLESIALWKHCNIDFEMTELYGIINFFKIKMCSLEINTPFGSSRFLFLYPTYL